MRIAVYSGSFNPLHIGHLAIMEYLANYADFDWVYLVVSPDSPFKQGKNNLSGPERYEAAVKAVCRHPELHVWVDDIELHMPPPQYTIKTLDALKEREKDNDFTLVIGSDNLVRFREWQGYKRILLEYGVVTYPRPGFDAQVLRADLIAENPDYRITVLEHAPMIDMSSTSIREGLSQGEDMFECLM